MKLLSEQEMRTYVIQLVRETVAKFSSGPLPEIGEITTGLGLELKEERLPVDKDGLLAGRVVVLNVKTRSEERRRFTCFHEITHHLINEDGELISILHDATWHQKGGYGVPLEMLCNVGAAEFLMPREEFSRFHTKCGLNTELILKASEHFQSSAIAATIQLAQVAPHSCLTAICERCPSVAETTSQARLFRRESTPRRQPLRVLYSASSPSTKYWLARQTIIPDGHPIQTAYLHGKKVEEQSYVPFRSGKEMPCLCEALGYSRRVYTIFHLSPPPNPEQMELGFV